VQPDHTYRIFAKHQNSNEAQVILLDGFTRYFPDDPPSLRNRFQYLTGIVVDHHDTKFFYATRIALRRVDSKHKKLQPCDQPAARIDIIDKGIRKYLQKRPSRDIPYVSVF
jgi:hypothetical protein